MVLTFFYLFVRLYYSFFLLSNLMLCNNCLDELIKISHQIKSKSNISRWLSSLWLLVPCNVLWQEKFGCVILGPAFRRLLLLLSWCSSLRITVLVFGGIVPTHLDHRSRLRWDCTDTPGKIKTVRSQWRRYSVDTSNLSWAVIADSQQYHS